jgi:hypothetical protein
MERRHAYLMALIMMGYGWLCMVAGMAFWVGMILEGRTPLPGFWSEKIYKYKSDRIRGHYLLCWGMLILRFRATLQF